MATTSTTADERGLSVPPRVSARAVERSFGTGDKQVHALGPLDFDIAEGEFACIVGPSGCGKSTFLRAVAGLIRPTAGEIVINHSDPKRAPLAMVFQDYGIFPWKTVEANVRFGLQISGVPKAEAKRRTRDWLGRMGLEEFADRYPDALSGGMRQRVAIARALVLEPEVLLMDEPFAALDAQRRELLQEELLNIWQADRRTVLFVTHSLEEALVLGDRVAVMSARPGRLLRLVDVPFERPRTSEIRATAEFGELKAELWELLRGEVDTGLTSAGVRP
jgi:NitT/TauT family transport system ATP-binding protein